MLTTLEDSTVETTEIKAHRVVLTAMSEPLDRMICGPMASVDENNVLTLTTGIDLAALLIVVEYIYTGTLEFTQGTDGVGRARGVHVPRARPRHETVHYKFLCEQLTLANAPGVAKAAAALHCAELEAAALAFAEANMTAVSEGAERLEMPLEEAVSLAC